jgi:putative cardiolipin synthase
MSRPAARRARQIALILFLCGCATLPKNVDRPHSTAISETTGTALGKVIAPQAALHPGESGILLFNRADEAIEARVALAEVAQSSIDAQYFMWAGDPLGRVLLARVMRAADRGVRVRLLVDDIHTKGQDLAFAAIASHPNIEVRVFNPFARGRLRLTQFLGRFEGLNRRMHNKMFVVDGQVAVVGGRNLADDYFGMGEKINFRDFDILAVGPVVPDAGKSFDAYWNSEWAYPIDTLRKKRKPEEIASARIRFEERLAQDVASFPYPLTNGLEESLAKLRSFRDRALWAPVEVVSDDPSRAAGKKNEAPGAVAQRFGELGKATQHEIVLENAYLVPDHGLEQIRALRARGVTLRFLTNSLASTDVVAVTAAYSKSRPGMAELGVELYEMRPDAASRAIYLAHPEGDAKLALHGKAAVFDREVVLLGSFNLDPRSKALDTEAVFVIHSPALASQLLTAFETDFASANAWRITPVVGKNKVVWTTERDGHPAVEPHEPAKLMRRTYRSVVKVLPIRRLL